METTVVYRGHIGVLPIGKIYDSWSMPCLKHQCILESRPMVYRAIVLGLYRDNGQENGSYDISEMRRAQSLQDPFAEARTRFVALTSLDMQSGAHPRYVDEGCMSSLAVRARICKWQLPSSGLLLPTAAVNSAGKQRANTCMELVAGCDATFALYSRGAKDTTNDQPHN